VALNASTSLPFPAAQVAEVLTDRAFVEHVSSRAGATLTGFSVSGPATGAFEAVIERTVPTERLPEMARKFVGDTLKVVQREQWGAPDTAGQRTVDITVDIAGAPVSAKAVQRLVASEGTTTVELSGEVSSSIPFLGGKIAKAAEPYLGKALNLQAAEARSWLERQN
jgi:hypothetical protein